jgi:CHASE3 domain sensor protein
LIDLRLSIGKKEQIVEDKEIVRLLVEIRDLQRKHLEEYQSLTRQALENQRLVLQQGNQGLQEQERLGRLYRRALVLGFLLIVAGVIWLIWSYGGFR